MLDQNLKNRIVNQIKEENLSFADIPDYMRLVTALCNKDPKIQKETKSDNVTFQFLVEDGGDFWLKLDHGAFSYGEGKLEKFEMKIGMDQRTTAGVFGNRINATTAYLNRDMSFEGSLRHGLKFRSVFKMINKLLGV